MDILSHKIENPLIRKVIQRGVLTVSIPGAVIGLFFFWYVSVALLGIEGEYTIGHIVFVFRNFIFGFLASWLWWSITIPIWRRWAYKVLPLSDIKEFKKQAIKASLTWPDNHIFAKTEFKTHSQRQFERDIETKANALNVTDRSPAQDLMDHL